MGSNLRVDPCNSHLHSPTRRPTTLKVPPLAPALFAKPSAGRSVELAATLAFGAGEAREEAFGSYQKPERLVWCLESSLN